MLSLSCYGKMQLIALIITFTFMHLADAFIQSDLQAIQAIQFLSVCGTITVDNCIITLDKKNAFPYHYAAFSLYRQII